VSAVRLTVKQRSVHKEATDGGSNVEGVEVAEHLKRRSMPPRPGGEPDYACLGDDSLHSD
jgi:hypothetical protein